MKENEIGSEHPSVALDSMGPERKVSEPWETATTLKPFHRRQSGTSPVP